MTVATVVPQLFFHRSKTLVQLFNGPMKRFNPVLQILNHGNNGLRTRFVEIENLLPRQLAGTTASPSHSEKYIKERTGSLVSIIFYTPPPQNT